MGRGEGRDPQRVRGMFGEIAPRYDLLNRLLSANLDRGWRRVAARVVARDSPTRVLDLCGGTGDLTLEVASRTGESASIVCCDFAHPMLLRARQKFSRSPVGQRCLTLEADGLRLPFGDGAFDAVALGFGIRNLACLDRGLREIRRVLRHGGRLVVLEFSRPTGRLLAGLYGFYLRRVLPRLGDGISGSGGAYRYLARTIADFPEAPALADRLRAAGFAECGWTPLAGGIVAIHTGQRAG